MAIKTNYFDGETYLPADLVNEKAALFSNGVFSLVKGDFVVSATSPPSLSLNIAPGNAVVNGYFVKSDAVENVPIVANTSGYPRYDIIVIEVDTDNKLTSIKAVQGTPASTPTVPIATLNQLKLATVFVGNNVGVIDTVDNALIKADILDGKLGVLTAQIGQLNANKADKEQGDWIAPTLVNGFTNYGGDGIPAGYRKDSFGFLHIRGKIAIGAAITNDTTIFTLDSGYMPLAGTSRFIKYVSSLGTGIVSVAPSGTVKVQSSVSSPIYVDLGEIIISLD